MNNTNDCVLGKPPPTVQLVISQKIFPFPLSAITGTIKSVGCKESLDTDRDVS